MAFDDGFAMRMVLVVRQAGAPWEQDAALAADRTARGLGVRPYWHAAMRLLCRPLGADSAQLAHRIAL